MLREMLHAMVDALSKDILLFRYFAGDSIPQPIGHALIRGLRRQQMNFVGWLNQYLLCW